MSNKETGRINEPVYHYQPTRKWPAVGLLAYQLAMPYILVATVQSIAFFAAFAFYLTSSAGSDFIQKFVDISAGAGGASAASGTITFDTSMFDSIMKMLMSVMQTRPFLIAMTIGYIVIIGAYVLIVRRFEKRPTASMGLSVHEKGDGKRAIFAYLRGLGIGFAMMLSVFLLLLLTGQAKVTRFGLDVADISLFVIYIMMWIPQGASEEIMTRGYMLPRLSPKFGRAAAVAITSLYFGLLHTGNSGFSLIPFINLILIAVFFAMLALYTNEIWTVCALHSVWNFAQGNLFGFEVSGTPAAASLISTTSTSGSSDVVTGGAFGPEGGLVVTGVIIIALMILLLMKRNRRTAKTEAI